MKKYKLINTKTKEEHFCNKITIDGFDYYVNEEKLKVKDKFYFNIDGVCDILEVESEFHLEKISSHLENKKVIATNKPNIDIPKVVDEVEIPDYAPHFKGVWLEGYNKSQETHPFSEDDVEFFVKKALEDAKKSVCWSDEYYKHLTKELLQLWKEQQTKIIYYNE